MPRTPDQPSSAGKESRPAAPSTAQPQAPRPPVIRVLLADDHSLVREGFRRILDGQPDIVVVGEAPHGRAAIDLIEKLQPDVLLMDVTMPEMNGIEATRRLARQFPHVRVLALSMQKDRAYVREMLRAGARGYLLKECEEEELLSAIREVGSGRSWLSPHVCGAVLDDYVASVPEPIDLLSTREREVLQLIALGTTNQEIAARLKLSVYTIESHRLRISQKLNLNSSNEIVRFAIRHRLID